MYVLFIREQDANDYESKVSRALGLPSADGLTLSYATVCQHPTEQLWAVPVVGQIAISLLSPGDNTVEGLSEWAVLVDPEQIPQPPEIPPPDNVEN